MTSGSQFDIVFTGLDASARAEQSDHIMPYTVAFMAGAKELSTTGA